MNQIFDLFSEEMVMALVVWMCTIPLVAYIVLPLFGLQAVGFAALILFFVILLACWKVCGRKLIH